jgi:hypothetical protein
LQFKDIMLNLSMPAQRRVAYVLTFSTAVALLIAFSGYYDGLNADTAVAYMNGFVRWTPFFWGSDRYGMLIPALTSSLTNPLANMIAQNTLHIFTSVICFFLLARFFFPGPKVLEIGVLALAGYLLLSGLPDIKEYLSPWNIYTPAMMLGLLALLAMPRYWWLALALGLVAEWCNFAVYVFLAILLLVRSADEFGRIEWPRLRWQFAQRLAFLATIALAGYAMKAPFTHFAATPYAPLPWPEAIQGWIRLGVDYCANLKWTSLWLPIFPAVVGLAAIAYVAMFHAERWRENRTAVRSSAIALVAALYYAMVVGASIFAKLNGFPRRYLIPSLMLWMVPWVGLTLHLLPFTAHWKPAFKMRASLLLLPLLMWRFGTPSLAHVREALDRRFQPIYAQIPSTCTHVAGDYYRVWDSVLYSRLKGDRPLWGIAYRAEVVQDLWALEKFKNPHVCYWRDNELEARELLAKFQVKELRVIGGSAQVVELGNAKFGKTVSAR